VNSYIGKTYAAALDHLVERFGDREALLFEGRRYSFAEVKRQSDRAAARLAARGL
jgi:fatty-acyl-CoA synthase